MGLKARSSPGPRSEGGREDRIRPGLLLLRDALERAHELRQDAWNFAVDICQLREVGLTNTDLRWLLCQGYAEHGIENGSTGTGRRSVLKITNLSLPEGTRFVLTARGLLLAGREPSANGSPKPPADGPDPLTSA